MKSITPAFEQETLTMLKAALDRLEGGFSNLPMTHVKLKNPEAIKEVLLATADHLREENPYFHPLYAGQMLKPPHPIARTAYALAMWINPNNHALDASKASSPMEKEVVTEIAGMFGWKTHLGHLTSGGTMANLEALWVASKLRPGTKVVASQQAHYTHQRISTVLGLNFESIACDRLGRMDIDVLKNRLAQGGVGTVVVTLGTTATGSVDPLPQILELRKQYDFHLHVDTAYGGYFTLVDNLNRQTASAYERLREADSIVVDPHKHGLQPYGCGCVLFRDPSVGKFYKHDSPYTYFSSTDLHLGEISLECSRPGAAAVALWATQKLLPLVKGGEFADMIAQSRKAALTLYEKIKADDRFITAFAPELDIIVWAPRASSISEISKLSRRIFEEAAKQHLHIALADLPVNFFSLNGIKQDQETMTCLRSVLMKPEHLAWVDKIWKVLDNATDLA